MASLLIVGTDSALIEGIAQTLTARVECILKKHLATFARSLCGRESFANLIVRHVTSESITAHQSNVTPLQPELSHNGRGLWTSNRTRENVRPFCALCVIA